MAFLRVLPSFSLCCLHCSWSHSAPSSAARTRPLAKSKGGQCASTRGSPVRMACTRASRAAKAGMELEIAASTRRRLRWCHHHSHPLYHLHLLYRQPRVPLSCPSPGQRSPRVRLCSCLASVARVKESLRIWCFHCPAKFACSSRCPGCSSAAQQSFGVPRGRGPSFLSIDSITNSSINGDGRGVGGEYFQAAHEHQREDPCRSW